MRTPSFFGSPARSLIRAASSALLLLCTLAIPASALADDKDTKKDKKDSTSKTDSKSDASSSKGDSKDGIRRDVNGLTGISPFTEKLIKGHKLMVARNFTEAVGAYKDAISESPNNPLGHLYVGAAQQAAGNLDEADLAWQAALRFVGNSDDIAAKVLFLQADLKERQKKLDEAKTAWEKYGKFVAEHPKAGGFPGSAAARTTAIDAEVDITKKYAEVKARIAKRLAEMGKGPADAPEKPAGKK